MPESQSGSTPAAVVSPDTEAHTALTLTPPEPVVVVDDAQATGAIAVDAAKQAELHERASKFAAELADLDSRSPEFAAKINTITTMGERDLRASASVSSRMLDRPAAAVRKYGGDAQSRVAATLVDLRSTIAELDPNRSDLRGTKRVLRFLPGGDRVARYFAKYQSAQSQLNVIIQALDSGQNELRKDNAAIETEKVNMWSTMGKLSEYSELAGALDGAVTHKVSELQAAGRTADAQTLQADALFAIRQRRQDIATQMAVSVQGYMALDLIRKNNVELIKGVDRAQTTTIAALRTAIIVAQALDRQKLVLDQITALNTTTADLIQSTSEQLRTQGAEVNRQSASSTVDIAKLQSAFDNVFQTMDAIDTFRSQAVQSVAQTVAALEAQVERAKPYLERTRRNEQAHTTPNQLDS
jgi:uncharacterized protein YaaN involved in tellurite resistance